MCGDRKDGRLVRDDADPMHLFIPYIMPMRSESEVYLNETVDVTNLLAFLEKKNENAVEGSFHMTIFHVVVSAVSKTILHRPYMNRFVAGRRLYQRDVVTSSFVVKKRFKDEGEEGVMILKTDGDSTLDQVAHKIYGDVKETREEGNSVDGVLKVLKKCPRFVLRFFMRLLIILDYFGKLPAGLLAVDPYHTTVMLSNLGSIKCPAPYHHLINFGTNSIIITIGEIKKARVLMPDGSEEIRSVMDLGVTLDERIGDGFYFARSVKLLRHLLEHPELLEEPFKEKIEYEY